MKQIIAWIFSSGVFTFLLCVAGILTKVLTETMHSEKCKKLEFKEKVEDFFILCLIISIWLFATSIGMFVGYSLV